MSEVETPGDATAAEKPSDAAAARGAFLTSIDATAEHKKPRDKGGQHKLVFKTLEQTNAGPRITEHHRDITELANTLDQRLAALLREHEKDFFLAYKTHMYTVQKEIKTLKYKAEQEEAKTRGDTKIKALEGELDWFMTEALRLDELCKGYKKEVDKWKAKSDALDNDRRFLEDQIKGAKRQNKILRAAAERARSSAYSALMTTKARAEGGYPAGAGSTLALAPAEPAPEAAAHRQRPASADGVEEGFRPAAGSGARRALEARARTPDGRQGLSSTPGQPPRALANSASETADTLLPRQNEVLAAARGGVLGNEAEERYVQAIQHLKNSIAREQQTARMLQARRATQYSQKSELEELFLKCIDEARKQRARRPHATLNKEKSAREKALESLLSSDDILVSLYERLFPHRSGIARSLGNNAGEDARMAASQFFVEDQAA